MQAELDSRAARVRELQAAQEKLQVRAGSENVARCCGQCVLAGGMAHVHVQAGEQRCRFCFVAKIGPLASLPPIVLQAEADDLTQRCTQLHSENLHLSSMLTQRDNELQGTGVAWYGWMVRLQGTSDIGAGQRAGASLPATGFQHLQGLNFIRAFFSRRTGANNGGEGRPAGGAEGGS